MARNIEIKARIASVEVLLPRVAALAREGPIEIVQQDTFFRCEVGRLPRFHAGFSCCHDKACELDALRVRQIATLKAVLAINAVMFAVELAAGLAAGSVSLLADSPQLRVAPA